MVYSNPQKIISDQGKQGAGELSQIIFTMHQFTLLILNVTVTYTNFASSAC